MAKELRVLTLLVCFIVLNKATSLLGEKMEVVSGFQQKIGIPISQVDFDSLVNSFTAVLQKGDSIIKIDDFKTLARLENTIYYSDLYKVESYKKFTNLYSGKYATLTIEELHAKPRRGLYFYSEKFDLYLGGPMNANSLFLIVQSK